MSSDRLTRVNELLKRTIAETLYREMSEADFDTATVTVTGVHVSADLHSAHVHVSITGSPDHQQTSLRQLRRHRAGIQKRVSRQVKLKYTPLLHFELDTSIQEGDRVLQLIAEMERTEQKPEESPSDDE